MDIGSNEKGLAEYADFLGRPLTDAEKIEFLDLMATKAKKDFALSLAILRAIKILAKERKCENWDEIEALSAGAFTPDPSKDQLEIRLLDLPPRVSMTSLVGIDLSRASYPLSYGNYCAIADGPYLCNIWAENLEEWANRNPEVKTIRIHEYRKGSHSVGMVVDKRLDGWLNSEPCVTGNGWPDVTAMRIVCASMGASAKHRACGCEQPYEKPRIAIQGLHMQSHRCSGCGRTWDVPQKQVEQ